MTEVSMLELARINARGVVQGVGFRPFVYRLASKYNLKGWVYNTSEDVKIEVQGERKGIECFLLELQDNAPPLARIEDISATYHLPADYTTFEIRRSTAEKNKYQLISPDIATCQACLKEIFDPEDRRYHYPFTNCTNCGPRFTIIEDIPYDRPNTTMRSFKMCPECQVEYDNPLDRRFHAQPNACPECGPILELVNAHGDRMACSDIITTAAQLLRSGKIIAIKGLGGFLLACDATNEKVVELLRYRKRRPAKPLAIMVADIDEAKRHCYVSEGEEKLLTSPQSPIVLMRWKPDSTVSQAVAPNLKYLGGMLPYTPLHHILLKETKLPLIMTSGNLSEEPIAKDNDEAIRRLSGIADYFLIHNRNIYAKYDDSVTIIEGDNIQLTRRARGYAPYPVHLTFKAKQVLGCGAQLKNTFCLTKDNYAFLSQHIGDMENLETMEHFENTLNLYKKLFRIKPEIIAYDLHPEYLSTKYALELAGQFSNIKFTPIQHHHAHIVSCMVDNGVDAPVIGVALDGTGYGSDGHVWGAEFLVADYHNFKRMGHLQYLPLPGGEAAIKRPYRTAIGYLLNLLGENALGSDLAFLRAIDNTEVELLKRQIQTGLNTPLTSSMGRLFDAVSALIGLRGEIDYEAQAAIELEMIAYDAVGETKAYPFPIIEQNGENILNLRELFSAIISDLKRKNSKANISAKFHNGLSQAILQMCQIISHESGKTQVALSGGVFQNRLLLRKVISNLSSAGFTVLTHSQVPCNDGGISLGQAVIANFTAEPKA